jgi:hypothetical protein
MPGMGTRLAEGPLRDGFVATKAGGNCVADLRYWLKAKNGSGPPRNVRLRRMPSAALRQGCDSTQVRIPMKIEDVVSGAGKVIDNQECRKLFPTSLTA